ncbi:tape measure protein [Xanthobacter sp. KR7-225]|uniref:tape measure protein n=1 Tax=Xanthobacter sp. KR7-225 TaxID=3156613 RepID=UPI0032B521DC
MATDLERLTVQVDASITKFERALSKMEGRTASSARRVESTYAKMQTRIDATFSRIGSTFKGSLAGGLAGITAALGVRELAQYADTWTRANNVLRVAGLSGSELAGVMDELFAAAQRQGVPIEALAQLYGRAARASKELGATKDDLVAFSEDVARALKVAGTSPEAASGALLQLGQLLGSSRVSAEEFNSVMEGAAPILQTVANGIEEAGGSVNRLKQLVNDGQLSNVAFFKGFQAGAAGLREQAAQAEDTIAQGMTRIGNAITKAVGEIDKTSGASKNATENLGYVAKAIEAIPSYVDATTGKLAELQKWLASVGNSPFWRQIAEFLGTDFSGSGLLRAGVGTPGSQSELNKFYDALGVNGSGGIDPGPGGQTVRAADYPVQSGPATGKSARQEIDEYAQLTAASRQRIADLQIEQQTLGMTAQQAAAYRFEQEALLQAQRQGIELSPQQRAELQALATEYGKITGEIEKTKNAQESLAESHRKTQQQLNEIGQIATGFYSDFANGMRQGETAAKSFGDAVQNLLNRIIDMMAEKAIMDFIKMLGSSAVGGGTGVSLFSTGGTVQAATGGSIRGPGSGTSDSIPAMLSNGEYVVNAAMAKKYGPLLQAINSGNFRLPAFATGGPVGRPSYGGSGGGVSVQIVNQTSAPATAEAQMQPGIDGRQILQIVLKEVRKDMVSDMERMGPVAKAVKGRFGLNDRRGMFG